MSFVDEQKRRAKLRVAVWYLIDHLRRWVANALQIERSHRPYATAADWGSP